MPAAESGHGESAVWTQDGRQADFGSSPFRLSCLFTSDAFGHCHHTCQSYGHLSVCPSWIMPQERDSPAAQLHAEITVVVIMRYSQPLCLQGQLGVDQHWTQTEHTRDTESG